MDKMPVFVKIQEYQDVTDMLALAKERLRKANDLLDKIKELKSREDEELQRWQQDLDDVEVHIENIDKRLMETEK